MSSKSKHLTLSYENPFALPDDTLHNEIPPPLVNVLDPNDQIIWHHIKDLDTFFSRIYIYHQKHGFLCMITEEFLESLQFIFIICLSFFMIQCINYAHIFKFNEWVIINNSTDYSKNKININVSIDNVDIYVPLSTCAKNYLFHSSMNIFWAACLSVAVLFLTIRLIRLSRHILQYLDIRSFYMNVLQIQSQDIPYVPWQTIVDRLKIIHSTGYRLSVHSANLSDSDILHRILRFQNYLTALVGYGENGAKDPMVREGDPISSSLFNNKLLLTHPQGVADFNEKGGEGGDLLPLNLHIPLFGEIYALNQGLLYNLELIFFRAPFSPFKTNWQLREGYKKTALRQETARKLERRIRIFAFLNFVLSPIIFLWQLLYYFFTYTQSVKNDPGQALGTRIWSPYADLYFRHYNELDHEFRLRLARAYPYANRFVASFGSRLAILLAKFGAFFSGSLIALALLLSALVALQQFQHQHNYIPTTSGSHDNHSIAADRATTLLTLITVLGVIYGACRSIAGPEDESETTLFNNTTNNFGTSTEYVPISRRTLLAKILAHVHYLPANWFANYYTDNNSDNYIVPEWDSEQVRDIFCTRFFELKLTHFLVETLGPVLNSWILYAKIAPKSQEIVDFFRNYTIDIEGVGDVCSLANVTYAVKTPQPPLHIATKSEVKAKQTPDNLLNSPHDFIIENAGKLAKNYSSPLASKTRNTLTELSSLRRNPKNILEGYDLPFLDALPEIAGIEQNFQQQLQKSDLDVENIGEKTAQIHENYGEKIQYIGENVEELPSSLLLNSNLIISSQSASSNSTNCSCNNELEEKEETRVPPFSSSAINQQIPPKKQSSPQPQNILNDLLSSQYEDCCTISRYSPVICKAKLSAFNYMARRLSKNQTFSCSTYGKACEEGKNWQLSSNQHQNKSRVLQQPDDKSQNSSLALPCGKGLELDVDSLIDSLLTMSTMGGGFTLISRDLLLQTKAAQIDDSLNNQEQDYQHPFPNKQTIYSPTFHSNKNNYHSLHLQSSFLPPLLAASTISPYEFRLDPIGTLLAKSHHVQSQVVGKNAACVPHVGNTYIPLATIDMSLSVLYFYNKYSRSLHETVVKNDQEIDSSVIDSADPGLINATTIMRRMPPADRLTLKTNQQWRNLNMMGDSLPGLFYKKLRNKAAVKFNNRNFKQRVLSPLVKRTRTYLEPSISNSNAHNYQTFQLPDEVSEPDLNNFTTGGQFSQSLSSAAATTTTKNLKKTFLSSYLPSNLIIDRILNEEKDDILSSQNLETNEHIPLLMKSFYPA